MYISITRDMYKHDIETITNNIYYTFLSHDLEIELQLQTTKISNLSYSYRTRIACRSIF